MRDGGREGELQTCLPSCPDGNRLATASADRTLRIWSSSSGVMQRTLDQHTQGVCDVTWNQDGSFLASASDDHTVKLWDVEAGQCLRTLHGHTHYVFCCSFNPQGNLLVSTRVGWAASAFQAAFLPPIWLSAQI